MLHALLWQAELLYKKREKKVAPTGWEAFNQKALYEAYEKRTSNIPYSQEVSCPVILPYDLKLHPCYPAV